MSDDRRSPERVLDELCETGRRWINARMEERRHGTSTIWATAGDNPPDYVEPEDEDRAAEDVYALSGRFRTLAREFIEAVEAP